MRDIATYMGNKNTIWNIIEEYPFELVPDFSILTSIGDSTFLGSIRMTLQQFQSIYVTIKKIRDAIANLQPVRLIRFKDASYVPNTEYTIDTNGYDTLDYLLVGGGGGGGRTNEQLSDRRWGGGGGASGYFKASKDGAFFDLSGSNITQTESSTSIQINSGKTYKVSIGHGGKWNDHNQITKLLYGNNEVVANGGGNGDNGNMTVSGQFIVKNAPSGQNGYDKGITYVAYGSPNGANKGGRGGRTACNDSLGENCLHDETQRSRPTTATNGENKYGGIAGNGIAGGGGGGGIGGGKGGDGATALKDNGSRETQGEDYTGAGGGGGVSHTDQLGDVHDASNGARGGHGYAIIRLSSTSLTPGTKPTMLGFLGNYTVSEPFQNQYPQPKDTQKKLMTQKLNAVQFVARPQPPTLFQSLLSFFS